MSKLKKLIYLCFLFNRMFKQTSSICNNKLEVDLPQGKIRGSFDWLKSQRTFLGIPYASIQGRFQAPGNPPSWNGTLQADQGRIKCMQYHAQLRKSVGQEECLVLNVFTPTLQDEKPFPVMVFIHGGGFYWGSNSKWIYNPHYLVKKNVIVVTINYRLGAFGFLCLGHKEAPGNAGLKDQIAALKWIQTNIIYFGGDPNSVTLFGQSVGAASINYLISSHSANELFHRAILQSGSILMFQAFGYTPVESASKIAFRLGYNTSDPNELLKIFKNAKADDIIKASYIDPTNNALAPYLFRPCIETAITSRRPLIQEKPTELLNKNGLNISVIVGFNDKEGIYWATNYYPITLSKIKEHINGIIPDNLLFETETEKKNLINDIEMLYFKNTTAQEGLIDYFTDSIIRYPLTVISEALCKKPNRSVYNYYFTYDSFRNINKMLSKLSTVEGANHADELFYLFDPVLYNMFPPNGRDQAMISTMVNLWTSFAKTGKPTNQNVAWYPSDRDILNFIELSEKSSTITLNNNDRINFWRETYKKYQRK